MLSDCSDYDEVVRVVEHYAEYRGMFEGVGTGPGEKTLEDKFFEYEVRHEPGGLKVVAVAVAHRFCPCGVISRPLARVGAHEICPPLLLPLATMWLIRSPNSLFPSLHRRN